MLNSFKKLLSFQADQRGHVGITFGMIFVPAIMFVGGAIDFGIAYKSQQKVQSAADAAVLAAVATPQGTSNEARQQLATAVFNANVSELGGVAATATANGTSVTLTANGSIQTSFLKIANIDTLRIGGSSGANVSSTTTTVATEGGKACLLALDPSATNGFKSQGTPNVDYTGCWAHTNSTSAAAVDGGGSAVVVGQGTSAVGGVSSEALSVYTPAPVGNQQVIPDPFATVSAYVTPYSSYRSTFVAPSISTTCKASNLDLKKGTFSLEPGRYCGGINIQAHAKVTFAPGEYIIDNGEFNVQSGSSVSGSDVLFYFSGAAARFTIIGGGAVNLKGRTTGPSDKQGFLFIAHPNAWRGLTSNIQGGGTFNMEGMIYTPTQNILITGNGDANQGSNMFGIVAKSFEFRGNGIYRFKPWNSASNMPNILPTRQTTTTTTVSTPALTVSN